MKFIIVALLFLGSLFADKSPVDYFSQYDITNVMYDSSAKFVVLTNTNVPNSVLYDISYALNIYLRYVSIFPDSHLNGLLWWFGNEDVPFDRFWIDTYNVASRSTKMNMIYIKLSAELGDKIPEAVKRSRFYQTEDNQRSIESTRSSRGKRPVD